MSTPESDFSKALLSDHAAPRYAERLRRFGQLVGAWDAVGRRRDEATGAWTERHFTWVVSFILDGHGVEDVEVEDIEHGAVHETHAVATALRVYDPVAGAIRVTYMAPERGEYCNLIAIGWRDGIRQDGTGTDGRPIRWNFSSITHDSYVWDGWISADGGTTWDLMEHIEGHRKAGG